MMRNVVLVVSSLAVLVVLFVGYRLLVGTPAAQTPRHVVDELPTPLPQSGPALRVGQDVEVPAGGRIVFRRYDERTGRPTDLFSCLDWQPVPGSKNEIRVTGPELAMVLPSGMVATVLADEGQLTAERIERQQMRPRSGWLAGNVRIIIDRDTTPGRPPRDERPQDLITLFVDRLEFDLERGELRSADRVVVQSLEFEVVGAGLDLVWSQADNRVETLTLARGEEFIFYTPAGLFDAPDLDETRSAEPAPAPALRTATAPRPSTPRRVTTYLCTLSGGVLAEQHRADQVVGGLRADEVQLLFDIGARAGRLLRAPASRPQAAADQDRGQRLVVRWSGKLTLAPIDSPPPPGRHRLHFTASGAPVALARGDGTILCGKVRYEDETRRIWLESLPGQSIDFALGEKMSAAAAGVFVDRVQRLVKLVGPLVLRSQRGTGAARRWSTVHAQLWGELTLAEPASATRPAAEAMLEFERLESATFVGDVTVDLGKQKLTADNLRVTFRPDAGEQTLEELLDTAMAAGRVRLTSEDGTVESQALELTFARTPEGTLYPSRMHARGAVRLARERARIRGDEVLAQLAPGASEPEAPGPEFVLRTLEVTGRAEVVDPDHRRAARGAHITSQFVEPDWLATATVRGTAERPGLVYAHPFIVRGQQIDLDRSAQTLHVEGPARLSFRSQRSLQGQQRKELTPVVVTSHDRLHIDGRANTVQFEGQVVATSRDEQLQGDAVTLLLEDSTPAPRPPTPRIPSWADWWRGARAVVDRVEGRPTRRSTLAWDQGLERVRKEPVRLIADNGLVSSESFVAGDPEPVVHASISAPRVEFDLVGRQIHTTGLTQLLLTDRRGRDDPQVTGEVLGLPSAFLSRGPSQTAMQCTGRMTYTLGADGPERRDTVVFEDNVFFVHRTGAAMVDLTQTLSQPARTAAHLPPGRNATLECERLECWFVVDQEGSVPQRGGGLTRTPMRLASLLASGSVYLRDEFGPRIREVNAAWIEFNREQSVINVRSTDVAEARVYFENTASGQLDVHTGKQLVIDLRDGTVRSGELRGHLRRP